MAYDKTTHRTLLQALDRLRLINEVLFGGPSLLLLLPVAEAGSSSWPQLRAGYVARVRSAVAAAGLDWTEWELRVKGYANALKQRLSAPPRERPAREHRTDRHEAALRGLINAAREPNTSALEAIEPSIEKAITAIEYVLERVATEGVRATAFPDLLTAISGLPTDIESPLKQQLREQLASGETPPLLDRHWDTEAGVAWLRYAERYELRVSRPLIESMCSALVEDLRDAATQCWPNEDNAPASGGLLPALHKCWVLSRSYRLRALAAPHARNVLDIASTWQLPNGAWPNESTGGVGACSQTTAFALACMLRYHDSQRWDERIRRAMSWALKNPNDGGGWGRPTLAGGSGSLNLLATVAVLDAARLQGVPIEHPAVAASERALLRAQHPTGAWVDYKGRAEDFLSPLVLGYFQRRLQRPGQLHEATRRGKGLLLRAHSLSRSDDHTDLVLALAALCHGVEYLVYGFILSADDSVPIRDSQGQTIGLGEALAVLEQLAKSREWLAQTAKLPHRQQLAEIKARRDEVIHRMGTTTQDEVDSFIEQALKFVDKFDKKALGFALLD